MYRVSLLDTLYTHAVVYTHRLETEVLLQSACVDAIRTVLWSFSKKNHIKNVLTPILKSYCSHCR